MMARQGLKRGNSMRRQQGMTLIGMLIVAAIAGVFLLAGIRLVPIYLEYLKVETTLREVKKDLDGSNAGPGQIRTAIERRFDIEAVTAITARDIKIERSANGYLVSADYEGRAPFLGNVYLVMDFDKSVEVVR
jgi:hypothetical protein